MAMSDVFGAASSPILVLVLSTYFGTLWYLHDTHFTPLQLLHEHVTCYVLKAGTLTACSSAI